MRTMPLSDYMHAALYGPDGYYRTHVPIGAQGDFTTAPEISQLFGEAVGAWVWAQWDAMGRPDPFQLVECGPGRGALMVDVLRTLGADPACLAAVRVVMLEVSERLQALQQQALQEARAPIRWAQDLDVLVDMPTIFMGNEFLDAFPVDHYKHTPEGWARKYIRIHGNGATSGWQIEKPPQAFFNFFYVPQAPGQEKEVIWEYSGAQVRWLARLAEYAQRVPVAGLWMDYGHTQRGPGETLQGVQAHQYADPLADFGRVDLSAHVNFDALGRLVRSWGMVSSSPQTQRAFLEEMGIGLRLHELSKTATEAQKQALYTAVGRLMAPQYMGTLFKAWAIKSMDTHSKELSAYVPN